MKNTCYVRGKHQYNTFDGLNYNFLAGCNYILVHDLDHTNRLDVILENDPNIGPNVEMKRKIRILTNGKKIELGARRKSGKFNVKIDGYLVDLPYDSSPKIKQVKLNSACVSNRS